MKTHLLWCLTALLLSPMGSFAQGSGLSGQLEGTNSARLRLELWDQGRREAIAETFPSPVGSFDFRDVPSGIYELRVLSLSGDVIHSQQMSLPHFQALRVNLALGATSAARLPMSVMRLQHKVPRKAMKEYEAFRTAMTAEDRSEAAIHLEACLRLDPQFFEAANDLGVLYLHGGRLSEAYEMFLRATTIDPGDSRAEANLSYVLLSLRRFDEAEDAARSSLRADSLSARARYLLAVSLLEQRKSLQEVQFHLSQARDEFEPARKLLEKLNQRNQASTSPM
jgi:tetratricopeptide (TPR) repeat protein